MPRREHLRLWRVIGAVVAWLCLAPLPAPALAASQAMQEGYPAQTVMEAPMQSMPMASDCMPCALCCLAPAPTTHGFSGERRQLEVPGWQLLAPPVPDAVVSVEVGGGVPRLPVRIVYCRWRD